jgi:hypothetical protein
VAAVPHERVLSDPTTAVPLWLIEVPPVAADVVHVFAKKPNVSLSKVEVPDLRDALIETMPVCVVPLTSSVVAEAALANDIMDSAVKARIPRILVDLISFLPVIGGSGLPELFLSYS